MLNTATAAAPTTTTTDTTSPAQALHVATTEAIAQAVAPAKHAKVMVVTPEGSDSPIVAYPNSPEYGYMQLRSVSASVGSLGSAWARADKRSCLIKGEIEVLESILENEVASDMSLPGKLVINEFEVNDDFFDADNAETRPFASQLDETIEDLEERLGSACKRSGPKGPALTVNGNFIARFTSYVHTDQRDEQGQYPADVKVAHDNVAEVRAYQAEAKAAKAGA